MRHPWELARLKILEFFIRKCEQHKSIIDIGSGDAFLAAAIANKFSDSSVNAIDINYTDELIVTLKKNHPCNLQLYTSIKEFHNSGKTDIILLMDVLEHVEDPNGLVWQILSHPSITSSTVFIITVPAYQTLFSQHDYELGHYKRYTIRTLNTLLSPFSFHVEYSGYCFNSLISIRILQVLQQKLFGKGKRRSKGIHNWKGGNLLTSFISRVFWIEFKITWYLARIGLKIPGLTCYSICRHSAS